MLIRAALAGVIAALLASCASAPPAVLPSVRDAYLPEAEASRGEPDSSRSARAAVADPADSDSVSAAAESAPVRPVAGVAGDPTAPKAPLPLPDEAGEAVKEQSVAALPSVRDAEGLRGEESSAVRVLLEDARAAGEARQYGRAAAALERALKVEPRNPRLWHRLATVRFRQGRHAEVVTLALRSRSLTTGDPDLDARNWRLSAAARQRMGDEEGARDALRRAEAR